MSAIVGIYHLDGRPVERADLKKMTGTLAHRGPDGEAIWNKGPVGLGHLMLWTTPESLKEKLPLMNRRGDLVMTADARIDNRDELIAALNLTDRRPEEITDSELILAAYEKWDKNCPEKLIGDFAFAIWDENRHELFCARDPFGVRPFYYYSTEKLVVFASEVKALLTLPDVALQINELQIFNHLMSDLSDKTLTIYKNIFRLPPAHIIKIDKRQIQLICYWSLDLSKEIKLGSNEEYAEAFREIFKRSVQCRLRSVYPIGSMLSGGLDSSSITCMARQLQLKHDSAPLNTFSIVFNKVKECDESSFMRSVTSWDGLKPYFVEGDTIGGPLDNLDQIHWHLDNPVFSGNLFLVWSLNKIAKQMNIRILLDGYDGDSTVSHGTGYIAELADSKRWYNMAKEARGYAKHFHLSPNKLVCFYLIKYGLPSIFSKTYKKINKFTKILIGNYTNSKKYSMNSVIHPNFFEKMKPFACQHELQSDLIRRPFSQRKFHYRRIMQGFHSYILEANDKTACAFSIEKRYPFWDRRLVEFCLALPPHQKLYSGWNRIVLRRAMNDILPKEIQWRGGKTDYSPNFNHAFFDYNKHIIERVIAKGTYILENYVSIDNLRNTYTRINKGQASDTDIISVWRAASLSLWLQFMGISK